MKNLLTLVSLLLFSTGCTTSVAESLANEDRLERYENGEYRGSCLFEDGSVGECYPEDVQNQ